ncbi:hypothetical protein C0Q70_07426 [Pomacea canaliculata]|uniref:Uncharacterized protein n=1 Tax=Pomacea canaliculata TaxID=400727 RepID=A0A2T7PF15_POMCA|nr:hypothetical protein C0Q70_07426 [Pomacea canaliculata]
MEGPEVVNQQQAYSTPQYGGPPPQWGYQPPVVTQPQMSNTNNTTVVINQQSAGPAYKPPRAWSTGICGCFDDLGVCCCVWWCTPCAISQLVGDMGEHCCVPCCVPGWLVALRTKLRTQHNIQKLLTPDLRPPLTPTLIAGRCHERLLRRLLLLLLRPLSDDEGGQAYEGFESLNRGLLVEPMEAKTFTPFINFQQSYFLT